MQFAIGIRIVGFISLVLGVLLLAVCGWTYSKFVTGEIGQNSTLAALKGQANSTKGPQHLTSEITQISTTFERVRDEWKAFKPFLMGSGGVAIAGGCVQVITALLLLCSGPKGARNRIGCFKMTHFIVGIALVVALIVPATFDVSHGSLNEPWLHKLRLIYQQIKDELHTLVDKESFSPDVVVAFYAIIAVDITGILIIIISTCCLMRNAEYDYREYP